jgi:hypothetical protein
MKAQNEDVASVNTWRCLRVGERRHYTPRDSSSPAFLTLLFFLGSSSHVQATQYPGRFLRTPDPVVHSKDSSTKAWQTSYCHTLYPFWYGKTRGSGVRLHILHPTYDRSSSKKVPECLWLDRVFQGWHVRVLLTNCWHEVGLFLNFIACPVTTSNNSHCSCLYLQLKARSGIHELKEINKNKLHRTPYTKAITWHSWIDTRIHSRSATKRKVLGDDRRMSQKKYTRRYQLTNTEINWKILNIWNNQQFKYKSIKNVNI